MRRIGTGVALALLVLAPAGAFGQVQNRQPGYSPSTRATVSPYVNLQTRRSPAVNYFGIVRQQRDIRTSLRQLERRVSYDEALYQAEADAIAAPGTVLVPAPVPSTGHPTYFQNLSHYYPTTSGATGTSIRSRRQ